MTLARALKIGLLFMCAGALGCSTSGSKSAPERMSEIGHVSRGAWGEWDGSVASDPQSRMRPMVGDRGMVVSDDREASAWGAEILRRGGNAVDAAVATAFALAVTRPHYAALGGGGFLLYCKPDGGDCTALDYRERAPSAAREDFYKGRPEASLNGAAASGVPGVTAGLLHALKRWGTLSPSQVLARPIELAEQGIVISSNTESAAAQRWGDMSPEAKRIWGCGTELPCVAGRRVRQPELALVLRAIAARGRDGFYKGAVASQIVRGMARAGGAMTLEDLASYEVKERAPIRGRYRGAEIITMPPPSAGGTLLLQMFHYMELADRGGELADGAGSARTWHALLSAMGIAYADRAEHFGDPDFVDVPVAKLLDPSELARKWKTFHPTRARIPPAPAHLELAREGTQTTHFSVIDAKGGAVALTTTVNDNFGSGFVPPRTGIVMNNEMDDFVTQPGQPNLFGLVGSRANWIAPGKRPLSSMSPTIARDEQGRNRIAIGAQGGPRITTGVFQTLFHRLRYEMSLPDAMAFGRVHHQWRPLHGFVEKNALSPEAVRSLTGLGWELREASGVGKLNAVERYPNGRTWGVPDPRTEGVAVRE